MNKEIDGIQILKQRNTMLEQLVVRLTEENMDLRKQKKHGSILFADWMLNWLERKKISVKENTFLAYNSQVRVHIEPYFRKRQIKLCDITPNILEQYYCEKYSEGLSGITIQKQHSNIHSALRDAVKNQMILSNPADYTQRPKIQKFLGSTLSQDNLKRVLKAASKTKYFTPVYITTVMGLRRSEVLGLRWQDIDFENRTMKICHTVVRCYKDHTSTLLFSDIPKTKSSRRTLPIPSKLFDYLVECRKKQLKLYEKNRSSYCKDYLKYICVDNYGRIFTPMQLSKGFKDIVIKFGCSKYRFHDLRHTCASLLIQQGVEMKSVSQWLGHSSISITSDVYVHLYYQDKLDIAKKLDDILE